MLIMTQLLLLIERAWQKMGKTPNASASNSCDPVLIMMSMSFNDDYEQCSFITWLPDIDDAGELIIYKGTLTEFDIKYT